MRRGVPGVELAAEPAREAGREAGELMRMRRPSLSNFGGAPGSEDQARFIAVGRREPDCKPEVAFCSVLANSVLMEGTLALKMAAAAWGSCWATEGGQRRVGEGTRRAGSGKTHSSAKVAQVGEHLGQLETLHGEYGRGESVCADA